MNKKIITFGHNENKKHKVHRYKNTILLEDEDIDNILIFYKVSFGEKN